MKITELEQAIDKTVMALEAAENRNYKQVITICRKQLVQAYILELLERGQTTYTIAASTGLTEKSIRYYRDADTAPTDETLLLIKQYLRKVRKRR